MKKLTEFSNYIYVLIGAVAIMGSLYYSEVEGLRPCMLCWYQRIIMYPLFPLGIVAVLLKDKNFSYYALILAIIGTPIAIYQYLLQKTDWFGEGGLCSDTGISCSTEYVNYLGFITIPLLSLIAFAFIIFVASLTIYTTKKSSD